MTAASGSDPTPGGDARGFSLEAGADGRLSLSCIDHPDWTPLRVDWTSREMRSRIQSGRKQALSRAIGLNKRKGLRVLDCTAGLGRDGFTLAALGAEVVMVERQTLLVELLRDAQRAARQSGQAWAEAAADRIRIVASNALDLPDSELVADVAYLDPMYDASRRRALPQKSMQMLRLLAGDDDDAVDLLSFLKSRIPRVVVKRPDRAPSLGADHPSLAFETTQARFDVYLRP